MVVEVWIEEGEGKVMRNALILDILKAEEMNLLMDLMWGVREKTASFLTHWKDGVCSLFI